MKKSLFLAVYFMLFVGSFFPFNAFSASNDWEPIAMPSTNNFSCIWINSANDIFLGSTAGEILRYDGSSWTRMYTGITTQVSDIWGSSSTNVFAASGSGVVLHYNGVGTVWTKMTTNTTYHMSSIWGSGPDNIYALGTYADCRIFHYNGSVWEQVPGSYTGGFFKIWGTAADNIFIAGGSGRILHYDGAAWSIISSGVSNTLYNISGSSASNIYAVGDNSTIVHYNGTAWRTITRNNPGILYGVWVNGVNDVYAVGINGTVQHFDGTSWSSMTSGTTNSLNAVAGSGADNIYVIGSQGLVLHRPATQSILPIDHFNVSFGIDTKMAGVPFEIELSAIDNNGMTVTEFTGNVYLAANSPQGTTTITPLVSGNFTSGIWVGDVSIAEVAAQSQIIVHDANGRAGQSALFDVLQDSDTDSDGITDAIENNPAACTDYDDPDTDSDGLADGAEDANHNGGLDPTETDPCNSDSDGDTLTDAEEINLFHTNPLNSDSDGDNLGDNLELSTYGTSAVMADTDRDEIYDGHELAAWGALWNVDTDGDGTINLLDVDSDNDGFKDGAEISSGKNPADPLDPPYEWQRVVLPSINTFSCVWAISANDVYIGSSAGEIFHYNGAAWTQMSTGITTEVRDIWASSATDVFAVSANGVILHYNGVGTSWTRMTTSTNYHMMSVWGSGPDNVYALGTYSGSRIFHYDGVAWSQVPGDYTGTLYKIWGTNADNIYVVGTSGRVLHFNGTAWAAMSSGVSNSLYDIAGSSAGNIYAVGDNSTIINYNGTSWRTITRNNPGILYGVWVNGANDAYAVGNDGTVQHFNGTNWSMMVSGTTASLRKVGGSGPDDLYVVGSQGMVLHRPVILGSLPVDHFNISLGTGNKVMGVPFEISVTAKDHNGATVNEFTGNVRFTASSSQKTLPVSPLLSANFTSGNWVGNITIYEAASQIQIAANDAYGRTGISPQFIVNGDDTDGDGLSDSIESRPGACTAFDNPDSDADGHLDGAEDANHNGIQDPGETNPCNSDSDGDGLNDGVETNTYGTNPLNPDTDLDGFSDGAEIAAGVDPRNPGSRPLAHFAISSIAPLQQLNTPFNVSISAKDTAGGTIAGYTGPVNISAIAKNGGSGELYIGNGTGTWSFPLYTYYHDARTQSIYLKNEIGGPKTIQGLALNVVTLPGQSLANWTIRMRHTTLNNYPATRAWESSWTVVYQGNTTISTTGWVEFTFQTPFNYNGSDNLMVDFSFNNSSYTSFGNCRYSSDGTQRTIYYNTDSGYGNPLNWTGTASPTPKVTTSVPNIKLSVTAPGPIDMQSNGSITNGVWSGTITIQELAEKAHLSITDGASHTGQSNLFDVLPEDSDGDGLSDINEISVYGTNPLTADTDKDSLSDSEEVNLQGGTSAILADSDADGVLDGEEFAYWGANWNANSDNDGLINVLDADSDNDGYLDGEEIDEGSNPANPDSRPLDHFELSNVQSPQLVNVPFNITISAKDAADNIIESFTGPMNISAVAENGGTGEINIGSGTGTWAFPLYTYYHDARTQSIYLKNEIGGPKTIQGLALNVVTLPGQSLTNWTLRMRHTTLNNYPATRAWESSWTVVYQGNTTISTTGWVEFTFQTPFNYNGSDNLMVDFSFNNSSYTSFGNCRYSSYGTQRTIYYNTDSGYGNPLNWAGVSSPTPIVSTNVPNIKLKSTGPAAIALQSSGSMVDGVWSGRITLNQPGLNVFIRAASGNGAVSGGNRFNVLSPPDTTAPQVISVLPENGATQIMPSPLIKATFSEPVNASTLTPSSFIVMDGISALTGQIQCDGNTATFIADRFLAYNKAYTVTITSAVKDLAGNAMTTPYAWSFTTTNQIYSSHYTIYPTIAAYGIDGGANYGWIVDGTIDAIYPRTQYLEDVYVKKYVSLDFTKYMDCRSLFEFALPSTLNSEKVQIDSAILYINTNGTPSGYDGTRVNLLGYPGDGLAKISDFNSGNNLGIFTISGTESQRIETDISAYINSLFGVSNYAGFILQPAPYATDQHVNFWNGLPHPAFGYISGQIVTLTINFTVVE